LNSATLTVNNVTTTTDDDPACQPPPEPEIDVDKDVVGVVNNGNGEFTVTYDITVDNTGGPGTYSLADAVRFGAGITVDSASIVNVIPGGIATNPSWNGTTVTSVVSNRSISAGATHLYRVTVDATVTTSVTEESVDCILTSTETGTGFLNTATITVNKVTTTADDDDACQPPEPPPAIAVDKDVIDVDSHGGGRYTLTYDITVANSGGPGTYSLADAVRFGAGITVDSASIVNVIPGGIATNPSWNGSTVTSVVSNRSIGAGATHLYRVTVDATVSTSVTEESVDCILTSTETGTGFLNTATITVNNVTTTTDDDDACQPPPPPPPPPPTDPGTTDPTTPEPPTSSSGQSGGGLMPITGSTASTVVAAAAMVTLLGLAVFLISRRRRHAN
jgi:LPXTG-motif cell wall-anchored protein